MHKWEAHQEIVTRLAKASLKSWMIGTEIDDIKNELWVVFFETIKARPSIPGTQLIRQLEQAASAYKNKERVRVFGQDEAGLDFFLAALAQDRGQTWDAIRNLWDEYLCTLTPTKSMFLRYLADGLPVQKAAHKVKWEKTWAYEQQKQLLIDFKRRVDERLQANPSRKNS